MKKEIPNPYVDGNCFYCGWKNKDGFKLKFYLDDETREVSTEFVPAPPFIGQGNIVHCGIHLGLLDEIMGWTSHVATGEMAVTSDIQVKLLKPVYLGKQVKVTCRVISRKGRKVRMRAEIEDSDGNVCSVATGTYQILSMGIYESMIHAQ